MAEEQEVGEMGGKNDTFNIDELPTWREKKDREKERK